MHDLKCDHDLVDCELGYVFKGHFQKHKPSADLLWRSKLTTNLLSYLFITIAFVWLAT